MPSNPVLSNLMLIPIVFAKKEKLRLMFSSSVLAMIGAVLTFGLSTFPFVMASNSHPAQSLIVWNASSSQLSLIGILICVVIMVPIIFIYTGFVYHKMWNRGRRLSPDVIKKETHELY